MTPPNGGGTFVYGFNSLAVVNGGVGLAVDQTNFTPMAEGGSIRGAMKRGVSSGNTNFSPFLFIGLQGPDISDNCYMLGLQDVDPSYIVLRKGQASGGLPNGAAGTLGILRRSAGTISNDTWVHLRLDMIYNISGDVVLKCFQSDLGTYAVTSPTWVAISGMSDFTDDSLGVNSGSAPYTSGRGGFGFAVQDISRRAFFDQIELFRQL
jgi:hypothetical protein